MFLSDPNFVFGKNGQAVRDQVRTVIDIDASIDLPRLTKLAAGAEGIIEEIAESRSVISDGSVTTSILDYSILDYSLMAMDWLKTLVLTTVSRCDAWNVSVGCHESRELRAYSDCLGGEDITGIDTDTLRCGALSSDSHYAIALVSIPVPDT